MKYLLDTNICVHWLKGNEQIEQKVLSTGIDNIFISFINVSELYYGAYKSQRVDENLATIRQFTDRVTVIESDEIGGQISNLSPRPKSPVWSSMTWIFSLPLAPVFMD